MEGSLIWGRDLIIPGDDALGGVGVRGGGCEGLCGG